MDTEFDYFLLAQASQAALKNAREYAEQAELLDSRGWYGRAMALAILGQEDVGKAFLLAYTAVGAFPADPRFIDAIKRRHWPKQLMSCIADVIADFAERSAGDQDFDTLRQAFECTPTKDAGLADEQHLRTVIRSLLEQAKPLLTLIATKLLPLVHDLPTQFDAIRQGSLDSAKQRGQYVDVDHDQRRIASPSDVGPDDSRRQRDRLTTLLAHVPEAIPEVDSPQKLDLMRRVLVTTLALTRAQRK